MIVDVTAFKEAIDTNISDKTADNSIFPVHVGGGINNLADLIVIFFSSVKVPIEKNYTEEEITADGAIDLFDNEPPEGSKLMCAYVTKAGIETPVGAALYDRQNKLVTGFGDYLDQVGLTITLTFI